eukprot:c9281_g1_i2.p1 GENE.c9281_g1_i2~~c9281_g1_i2.p1  ORF type:complete len:437 (+),score=92.94 c9281_g1_i2:1-1311(+)
MGFYPKLANTLLQSQVSVYLFAACSTYVDLASVGLLANTTGGQIHYYNPFKSSTHGNALLSDVHHVISRPRVFESLMRVRLSQGLTVQEYLGRHSPNTQDDFDLPGLHSEQSFAIELTHDGKLAPVSGMPSSTPCAYAQTALLFTTLKGERRVRIHTLALPISDRVPDVFAHSDLDAMVMFLHKKTLKLVLESNFGKVREYLMKVCVDLLAAYRSSCVPASTSSGQLILPETLKLLPLFVLSMTKHPMLRSGADVRADLRISSLFTAATASLECAGAYVYPRCFRVDNLEREDLGKVHPSGQVILPEPVPLASEKFDPSGAYLFDDGVSMLLHLGRSVPSEVVSALCVAVPNSNRLEIAAEDSSSLSLNGRFHTVIGHIRKQRRRLHMYVEVVRAGDPRENALVFAKYVEDRTTQTKSYMEFLIQLHRVIMQKLNA